MIAQLTYLFVLLLSFPQQDCKTVKKNKEAFQKGTSKPYNLAGFGAIPYDSFQAYRNNSDPFVIENNCLSFKITHGGCACTFEMLWDGTCRTDEDHQKIADIKFILSYDDPCKMLNHTDLKFNLTELLNYSKADSLYINFIGYKKLIKVKAGK